MLRAGSAVVGVWNEAFDPDDIPPASGATVPGVERFIKADPGRSAHPNVVREQRHE
jgi:type IV secretion system protein VirB9